MSKLSAVDSDYNIALVINLSNESWPNNPILASLTATQAILEGALQRVPPSSLALNHNNLFGQKPGHLVPNGTDGVVTLSTTEYSTGGTKYTVQSEFIANKEIEDSFEQRKLLFKLPRYDNLATCKTFEEAAVLVQQDGYATDPNYSNLLCEIYSKYIEE